MKLVSFEEKEGEYSHTFKKNEDDGLNGFSISEINVGDYIVINTNERINISAGYVADMKDDSISVLLDRLDLFASQTGADGRNLRWTGRHPGSLAAVLTIKKKNRNPLYLVNPITVP